MKAIPGIAVLTGAAKAQKPKRHARRAFRSMANGTVRSDLTGEREASPQID